MAQAKKKASKKKTAKKVTSKKATKKTVAKKVTKKTAVKKTTKKSAKKTAAKKTTAKKSATKKTAAKKTTAKKTIAKKTVAKKTTTKKVSKKTATAAAKTSSKKTTTSPPTKKAAEKPMAKPSRPTRPPEPNVSTETMLIKDFKPYQLKNNEEYMNAEQVGHFRYLLNALKSQLLKEVERTVHHMRDEAANFPDPNDRATQESEFSLELRNRDRERKLIKKIDGSLSDLDNGEYGFCESCGIEIGIRRLEARPTANLCYDCKELDEIKERQFG